MNDHLKIFLGGPPKRENVDASVEKIGEQLNNINLFLESLRKTQGLCQIYNDTLQGVINREKTVNEMKDQITECREYLAENLISE